MLMALTNEGILRTGEAGVYGLKFVVTQVAYGSSGFNVMTPAVPLALNPAATALVAEVFRKDIPLGNTVIETIETPRGQETTYSTVGGDEFTGIIGEAGLFATVTDPGTTALPLGYQFLLAQAHFGRICFSIFDRLAIKWPIAYNLVSPLLIAAEDSSILSTESSVDLEA